MTDNNQPATILWLSNNTYGASATLDLHSHEDYFQIHYICSGTGLFFVNGTEMLLAKGMLLFVRPGTVHGIRNAMTDDSPNTPLNMIEIKFLVKSPTLKSALEKLPISFSLSEDMIDRLLAIYAEGKMHAPFCEEIVSLSLQLLLYKLLQKAKMQEPVANGAPLSKCAQSIEAYIDEHFSEDVSLDDIAAALGYSKNYLCKIYHEQTGSTINTRLNTVRVYKAIQLLLNTSLEVEEIARACGYNNLFHFMKTFKKFANTSPGNYRQRELSGHQYVKGEVTYEHIITNSGVVGRGVTGNRPL